MELFKLTCEEIESFISQTHTRLLSDFKNIREEYTELNDNHTKQTNYAPIMHAFHSSIYNSIFIYIYRYEQITRGRD